MQRENLMPKPYIPCPDCNDQVQVWECPTCHKPSDLEIGQRVNT